MKKKFWMLGVALAALTSCTQSEVVEVPEVKKIKFDPFVNKTSRVAYQIEQAGKKSDTHDNLYQFWVFGKMNDTDLFNGTETEAKVYYDTLRNAFTYETHKTWDLGETYNFAAYSNGNRPHVSELDADDPESTEVTSNINTKVSYDRIGTTGSQLTIKDYTVGEQDLLAAIVRPRTVSSDADVDEVPFIFQHMLSCVQITIKNNSAEYYLQVNNIELEAVKTNTCVYSINNGTKNIVWDTGGTNGNYIYVSNFPIGGNTYLPPTSTMNMICFVIPQSNKGKSVEIEVKTYRLNGENYEATTTANQKLTASLAIASDQIAGKDHSSWLPGYQYNYTAELSGNAHPIHFTVEAVEDWTDTTVGTVTSASTSK